MQALAEFYIKRLLDTRAEGQNIYETYKKCIEFRSLLYCKDMTCFNKLVIP
jgi:hypothetical protein